MKREAEHLRQLIQDLRMKAAMADDPYLLKSYAELIEQYESKLREIEKSRGDSDTQR